MPDKTTYDDLREWLKKQFRQGTFRGFVTDYEKGYNDALLDVMNHLKKGLE